MMMMVVCGGRRRRRGGVGENSKSFIDDGVWWLV